jgi:alpha-beta hydrolase superfamily lysophospholipase
MLPAGMPFHKKVVSLLSLKTIYMKHACFLIAAMLIAVSGWCRQWSTDVLGDGYEATTINQGRDYSGDVVSTVVRKRADKCNTDRAILYIHGYNDYFFQSQMGDRFVDSCYNFYAVDLRKYGRSLRDGQRPYEARDISEYYADIDSALRVMAEDGIKDVTLMGHSTGGLVASSYMNANPSPMIERVILNSPFLEWNMGGFMKNVAVPVVSWMGGIFPDWSISQGDNTAYAESLLKDYHGEWTFNTDWKTVHPRKVTAGWLEMISDAQKNLKKNSLIKVPVLLMHSDHSVSGSEYSEAFQRGDAVLNVEDISRIGRRLGPYVTEVTITDGLHDLVLSAPAVREDAYRQMFDWLSARQW